MKRNASKYLLLFLLIVVIAGLLLAGLALGQDTATNKATTSIKSDSVEQQRLDLEREKLEFERERLDRELKSKDDDRELAMNQFMEEKRKTTALIVGACGAFATIIITLLTFLANQQAKERERFDIVVQSITSPVKNIKHAQRLASINSLRHYYNARSWMLLRRWGWPYRKEIVNLIAACFKIRAIRLHWRSTERIAFEQRNKGVDGQQEEFDQQNITEDIADTVFFEALSSVMRDIAPARDYTKVRNLFSRVCLMSADFMNGYFHHNPFANVDMTFADLRNLYLKSINLRGVNLGLANLNKTDLTEANLSETVLSYSHFVEASMFKINLTQSKLIETDLRDVDLCASDLRGANLWGARINEMTNFGNAICDKNTTMLTNLKWKPGAEFTYLTKSD